MPISSHMRDFSMDFQKDLNVVRDLSCLLHIVCNLCPLLAFGGVTKCEYYKLAW